MGYVLIEKPSQHTVAFGLLTRVLVRRYMRRRVSSAVYFSTLLPAAIRVVYIRNKNAMILSLGFSIVTSTAQPLLYSKKYDD